MTVRPKLKSLQPKVALASLSAAYAPSIGKWATERASGSTTARGYGHQWQKLRLRILRRDRNLCQCEECRSSGRIRPAHAVDHIVRKEQGGSDDPSNLQSINYDCHLRKTAREHGGQTPGGYARFEKSNAS